MAITGNLSCFFRDVNESQARLYAEAEGYWHRGVEEKFSFFKDYTISVIDTSLSMLKVIPRQKIGISL